MATLPFDTQPYRPKPGKWNQNDPSMNLGVRLEELLVRLGAKPAPVDDRRFDPFQLSNMPSTIGRKNVKANPQGRQGVLQPNSRYSSIQEVQAPYRETAPAQYSVPTPNVQGGLAPNPIRNPQGLQVAAPPPKQQTILDVVNPIRNTISKKVKG